MQTYLVTITCLGRQYVFCRLLAIYEYLSVAKYQELKRAQSDAYSVKAIAAKSAVGFGTQSAGSQTSAS